MKKLSKKLDKEMRESVIGTEIYYIESKFLELIEKEKWTKKQKEKMLKKKDLLSELALEFLIHDKRQELYKEVLKESLGETIENT